MAHNAYYQQRQTPAPPQQAQQPQYQQFYQPPPNIYQQLNKAQPQPHLQTHSLGYAQQLQQQPPIPANYQQQYTPTPQPQYVQAPFQTQAQQMQSTGFAAPSLQSAFGQRVYSAPSPQPPPVQLQQQVPPPSVNSYPIRPTSSFIPTSSFALGTPGFPGSSPEPNHQLQPQQPQYQQPPPQQTAPTHQPQQTGMPLSGSRPPISPSAVLAQQARIQQMQQAQAQAKAAAAFSSNRTTAPPSSGFAAAQSVFSGGSVPQTSTKRPLPQPAGNSNAKPPAPASIALSRSATTSRPMSMPPQISTSVSAGASSARTQYEQHPASAPAPSPTKNRPLPGTPGENSNNASNHIKRQTVDLGKISGLPLINSGFGSGGLSNSNNAEAQRGRSPSPTKFEQRTGRAEGGYGVPQLPPLSISSSSSSMMGGLSRTTSMAAGNNNDNNHNTGGQRPFDNDSTPKRRSSPPRFSSTSNSPTKEESNPRWVSSSSSPTKTSRGYDPNANSYGDGGNPKIQPRSRSPEKYNPPPTMTIPNSSSSSSASSTHPPTKKFTPIWKRTIPDYPAPIFGYAAGMVSDPFTKPPSSSTSTPNKSNVSPNTSNATPTGKGKTIEATTPTGKIKIRGVVSEAGGKGGSPSMLPYLQATPPKGFGGGTPPHAQGYGHGHVQSGMSNVYNGPRQGQGQGQRGSQQMYEETTEDDSDEDDSDEDGEEEDLNAAYQYEGSDYSNEDQHQPPPRPTSKAKGRPKQPAVRGKLKTVPLKGVEKGKAAVDQQRDMDRAKGAAGRQGGSRDYPDPRGQQPKKKGRSLKARHEEEEEEEDEDEGEEEEEEEEEEIYQDRRQTRKPARRDQYQYDDDNDYDNTPIKPKLASSSHPRSSSSPSNLTPKIKTKSKLIKGKLTKQRLRDPDEDDEEEAPSRLTHRPRGSESDGFVVVDTSPKKKGAAGGKGHMRHQSQRSELDDWEQLEWEQQQQRQRGRGGRHVRERGERHPRPRYVEEGEDEEEDEDEEEYEPRKQVATKPKRTRSVHRREVEEYGYEEDARRQVRGRSGVDAGHRQEKAGRYEEEVDEERQEHNQQQQQRRAQSQLRRMQSSYHDEDEQDQYQQQPRQSRHGSPIKFGGAPSGAVPRSHSVSPTKSSSPTKTMRLAEMWGHDNHDGMRDNSYGGPPSSSKEKGGFGGMGFDQPPLPHHPSQTTQGNFVTSPVQEFDQSQGAIHGGRPSQREEGQGYGPGQRPWMRRDASQDSSSSRRTDLSSVASSRSSVRSSVLSRGEFPPPPTHPSSPRPYYRLGIKDRERKSWYGSDHDDQASTYAPSGVGTDAEEHNGEGHFAYEQQKASRSLPRPPSIAPSTNATVSSPRKLVKSRPLSSSGGPPPTTSAPSSPNKRGYGHPQGQHNSETEFSHDEQEGMRKGGGGLGGGVRALTSKFSGFGGQSQPQEQPQPHRQQMRDGSPRKLPPTPGGAQLPQVQWPPNAQGLPRTGENEYGGSHGIPYGSSPSPAPSSTSSASTSSVKPPLPPRPKPTPVLSQFSAVTLPNGNSSAGGYQQVSQQGVGNIVLRGAAPTNGSGGHGGTVRGEVARERPRLKGGHDALDEPPPRSLRTPSPSPSSAAGLSFAGYRQEQRSQFNQNKRAQSMYAEQQQQQQLPPQQKRPQSQSYRKPPASPYVGSSGSFSPASKEPSISVPPIIQDPTQKSRMTPLPQFRQRQDIQCPAPVGGRDKRANLIQMEQEEETMNQQRQPHHTRNPNEGHHDQGQQNNASGAPAIPQINFDFVVSQSTGVSGVGGGHGRSMPSVPSIQINVNDGSSPSSRSNSQSSIPTISFGDFDAGTPATNEPQQQQSAPKVQVYEVPGISVSGPQFDDNPGPRKALPPQGRAAAHARRKTGGMICAGCEGPIVGRIVAAMNVRWHPQCFACSVCHELLEHVSSYEHDGRPYCHLDYHENFAPKCYSCKTSIIEEEFISLDDPALGKRTYHMEHFFCAECGDPFMTPTMSRAAQGGELALSGDGDFEGFTVFKGHPYCEPCHVRLRLPKCKKCKKSIRDHDRAVEALGGKWCWACFVCDGCHQPFEDPSFFQRDNLPYCEPCFTIILRNEV